MGINREAGEDTKDDWHGMRTGLALKPGNAGGVKVLTTFENRRETFAI
jgi:hypothetical protein